MPSWLSDPRQRARALLVTAFLAFCLGILIAAWTALVPFFLGMILAYLLMPIVNFLHLHSPRFLQRKGWARPLAIVIVYIALVGAVAGMLSYFIPAVTSQARTLTEVMPRLIEWIESLIRYDMQDFLDRIPPDIRTWIEANVQSALSTVVTTLQKGVTITIRTVSQTVSFVLGMVIIPFWLFYVLNDEGKIRRTFYRLIPTQAREDVHCIMVIIDSLLSAYIRGQLFLCLLVGVMSTAALVILRVELALLLGTIAGILEIIPILGPYLGAIPAVLIALFKRPILALWVALAFAAIQQVENVFLVPRISGNAVRFHPAIVMVIVVIGAQVAGLWGLLLAVPVTAVIRDVFQYLYLRTTDRGATPEMALEYLRARAL